MTAPEDKSLAELINDIEQPTVVIPDLSEGAVNTAKKDLFADVSKKAWRKDSKIAARCDFASNRHSISFRHPTFAVFSLWKRSVYGRTLEEIKADDECIPKFANGVAKLITQFLGYNLEHGQWCVVAPPRRRHLTRNFACEIAKNIAKILNIPYYDNIAGCKNKNRVNAVFHLLTDPPKESNVIVFDDIVTSGSTLIAMKNLLTPLGKNCVFFAGINNKDS